MAKYLPQQPIAVTTAAILNYMFNVKVINMKIVHAYKNANLSNNKITKSMIGLNFGASIIYYL